MTFTVFHKNQIVARGTREEVVPAMRGFEPLERASDLLAFDDETGRQIDLDLRPEAQPAPHNVTADMSKPAAPPAAPGGQSTIVMSSTPVAVPPKQARLLLTSFGHRD